MSSNELSGRDLIHFLRKRMHLSSYYQPLVIGALAEAGGSMTRDDLAKRLLTEDQVALEKAVRILMRWPKTTLQRHGVVRYHRKQRVFELLVAFENEKVRRSAVRLCNEMVGSWRRRESQKTASKFYLVVAAADGRCQACGVPGSERPLDIDHIVPRSMAKDGRVKRTDGTSVPVDDVSNLQVLCSRCNRGKRDTSTVDFRPSVHRIVETIVLALERGRAMGYSEEHILEMVANRSVTSAKTSKSEPSDVDFLDTQPFS